MNPYDFVNWLDGFSHSVKTRPTVEQWNAIKERFKRLTDTEILHSVSQFPVPSPTSHVA